MKVRIMSIFSLNPVRIGLCCCAFSLSPVQAFAGFSLITDDHTFVIAPNPMAGPVSENALFRTDGFSRPFRDYVPDGPSDPMIDQSDLWGYRYQLDGSVLASHDNLIVYSGQYQVLHVVWPFAIRDAGISSGTFLLTATFLDHSHATVSGWMLQSPDGGPDQSDFFDLSYGGNRLTFSGTYDETLPGVGGNLQGAFRQDAVPGMGTLTTLAAAAVATARRRRR